MTIFTFAPSTKKVANGNPFRVALDRDESGLFVGQDTESGIVSKTHLPPASIEYLLNYGLKQSLADSFASAENQADFDAMISKRLTKIMEGTMSFREGGTVDPFESECTRIAKAKLDVIARGKGKALPKRDSDEYKAMLAKVRAKFLDSIEEEARRRLAENEAEVADLDDDIFADAAPAPTPAPKPAKAKAGK